MKLRYLNRIMRKATAWLRSVGRKKARPDLSAIGRLFEIEYSARLYACDDGRYYSEYAGLATDPLGSVRPTVKTVAFYLPQMHPIPENDAWWGKGFTEWVNVSKAVPRFSGHYQPRLPGELGYYDLRCLETMQRQVELAKIYGLNVFCFYYYWFSGKRLLERPLNMFLSEPSLEMEFCICWANENWSRRWDGLDSEILIAQNHASSDVTAVFTDWLPYFNDRRYTRVNGRPLLLIYRPDSIPNFEECCKTWRSLAVEAGLGGLHILAASAFGNAEVSGNGLDGLYEFPPHNISVPHIDATLSWLEPNHGSHAFSYRDAVAFAEASHQDVDHRRVPTHPGALVGWDTESRKPGRGDVMVGSSPELFRRWLSSAFTRALRNRDAHLVFINAWNEWAEGAYLEPDRRHGYGYLTALRSVVREHGASRDEQIEFCSKLNERAQEARKTAVIIHLFYFDLVDEFAAFLKDASASIEFDLIVTFPDLWSKEQIADAWGKLKPRKGFVVSNVGRDVYPFLVACQQIQNDGYTFACKLHTKKSTHRVDGSQWRNDLLNGLLGSQTLDQLRREFFPRDEVVIAAPRKSFLPLSNDEYIAGNRIHFDNLVAMFGLHNYRTSEFIAGTMFWFRFDFFKPIFEAGLMEADFGIDLGQVDGTLAHAFERLFSLYAEKSGGKVLKIEPQAFSFNIRNR